MPKNIANKFLVYINDTQLLWQENKEYSISLNSDDEVEIIFGDHVIKRGIKILRIDEEKRNSDTITRVYLRSSEIMYLTLVKFRL